MTIIWPGCRPWVSSSSSRNPVGTPIISSLRPEAASISSIVSFEELTEQVVVLTAALLGDRVDLRLGTVDDVVDVALALRVPHLDDPRAGFDESAQDRSLVDDLGVVPGVGGGGNGLDELVQVRLAADPGEVAPLAQLVGDGDGVGRFPTPEQVEHGVEDRARARGGRSRGP